MKTAARRIIIGLAIVALIALAVLEATSVVNRRRLTALKEEFCNIELPPGSERRQCLGLVGTVVAGMGQSDRHCDYLVWMKLYSDIPPDEMTDWFVDRSVLSTDGETWMLPEVFESHGGIEPAGHRYRYHVQVIDAGHPPGLDLQCWFGV